MILETTTELPKLEINIFKALAFEIKEHGSEMILL